MMRKAPVIIWLTLLLLLIVGLFWHNEWVYNLPTPVPENYQTVNPGVAINLSTKLKSDTSKPLFLHFFNPDCPCSRFNIPHFKSLVKEYSNEVNFAIVVMSNKDYTAKNVQDRFKVTVPVLFDTSIVTLCGVYSTPQAVIIDPNHKLFYRGNYNKTRYCTDKKTEYAKMALDALLHDGFASAIDLSAVTAYGCKLPTCSK